MDNKENASNNYIELGPLLRNMRKNLKRLSAVVIIVIAVCTALMFFYARFRYKPLYKSEAVFTVSLNYTGTTDITTHSLSYDSSAAKYIAESFPYILSSDVMNERLLQTLGVSKLNGSVSSTCITGTNLFVLTVVSSNPSDAYNIINAVIDVYPQVSRSVVGDTQMSISKSPELASAPYTSFSWKSAVVKGLVIGLVLAVIIVLVPSLINSTLVTASDVKKVANLPCLACIPNISQKRSKESAGSFLLLNRQKPDSGFREAFRLLNLKLRRELKKGDAKVIMFTSSMPSEGKSSIAANVAISLAIEGKRVVLIDADLRAPNIKKLFGIKSASVGLGKCLKEGLSELDLLTDPASGLFIFAGDDIISDPIPLLKHERLEKLMTAMRNSFDYIIIDTPPAVMMADASELCKYADKVVYVIREDYITGSQLQEGLRSLMSSGVNVCGFVLNRVSSVSEGSGYGYGYGYGGGYKYGYGSGYKYGSSGKYGYGGKAKASEGKK